MLVFVLLASAMKLLGVPNGALGLVLLGVVLIGFALWGAVDAAAHPAPLWESARLPRTSWIRWLAIGTPFGIGFAVAIAYFARIRPRLVAATVAAREAALDPKVPAATASTSHERR